MSSLSSPKMSFRNSHARGVSTFVYSFNKYLLSFYRSGIVLGTEDIIVSKNRSGLCMHVIPSMKKVPL